MRFSWGLAKYEWFVTPAIGIITERNYYGYTVFAVAFAWLKFRCKVTFGVIRFNGGADNGE